MTEDRETVEQLEAMKTVVEKVVADWYSCLTAGARERLSMLDRAALTNGLIEVMRMGLDD